MGRSLKDMTLEELWELFPIVLVEHQEDWAMQYDEMEAHLSKLLPSHGDARISHVGSTAIEGIWAKPIVDVLVELEADEDMHAIAQLLEDDGFIVMNEDGRRISLNAGYTENGYAEKVYHVHLRYRGDNDELYFRDYLREHDEVAEEYEALKLRLWHEHERDRDAYTDMKGDFVRDVTNLAKEAFAGRYDR